jgi:hypothetical protein
MRHSSLTQGWTSVSEKRRGKGDPVGFLASEPIAMSDQKLELRSSHIVLGLSVAAIFSCAILFTHYVSDESVFMLIAFNFLFVSLTFPLNGPLAMKVLLLSMGNFIGVLWVFLFSTFVHAVADYFGTAFNALYLILGPFVNLIWIVTFYSLSLTVLAKPKNKKMRTET